ncbi:unnamed protein product, partial [Lymnaea stagnalis]
TLSLLKLGVGVLGVQSSTFKDVSADNLKKKLKIIISQNIYYNNWYAVVKRLSNIDGQGSSAYQTDFQWHSSFRSKSFKPLPEQMMYPAGLASVYLNTVEEPTLQHKKHIEGRPAALSAENVFGILSQVNASSGAVNEPALQHKKRVEGAQISLSKDFFSAPPQGPEFTLLGQQDKFAPNVCYQPKQSYSEEKIYKNRENLDNDAPPKKQLKMQKRIKPLIKERHPPNSRSPPGRGYQQHDPDSPPPAPRGHRDNLEIKEAMKDKDLKDVLGGQRASSNKPASSQTESSGEKQAASHQGPVGHGARRDELKQAKRATVPLDAEAKAPEKAADPTRATHKPQGEPKRPLTNMNASVQTNVKKGVTIASHEAPADYALKYKAGVAPPRPLQRVSEYQKQFQWKNGLKTSPLLAAEQIVYNSQGNLGPYKSDGVPKVSEYTRQFHPWQPIGYHSDINLNANNSSNVQRGDRKAQKKTV